MIRESAKIVKRGGEIVWGTLEFLKESVVWVLDAVLPWARVREDEVYDMEVYPKTPQAVSDVSPLGVTGPVPEELRRDPFPGGSVPWCIQEAEKEQYRARKMLTWKIVTAVSWSVTAAAVLRSLGVL